MEARTENSREEVNRGHAEYISWLNKQDDILKQKFQVRWFKEGDSNTKYFDTIIRDWRRKLKLDRIKNNRGRWVSGDEKMAKVAIKHFDNFFNLHPNSVDTNILNCIPRCISSEDNNNMLSCPQEDEIKDAVFNMSVDSAAGPDGYSGRLITENIQLAQEIVQDIKCTNRGGNMVIKLDMAKAYDRMSWPFLIALLQKFGFSDDDSNMLMKVISNVWYSIIINGTRNGFFSSSQGLKQGDPLSPSLFIIGAEVLARLLNELNSNDHFIPFSMSKIGPLNNHFSYVDGLVIFSKGQHQVFKDGHEANSLELAPLGSTRLENPRNSGHHCSDLKEVVSGMLDP
ncbi:uncharacterized protein LOC132044497 [Lycium ferocissimum]|uniref:uncharacterized protein LOC132044497 n=1 Tax=Lycium ferocissimum TaxID=112874 RepID=UPI002815ED8B|nr:uncharacterized protein LOC132044497 [Lycium ferocissimum]